MTSSVNEEHSQTTKAVGYWSGEQIEINQTDNIIMLDKQCTTETMIDILDQFRSSQLRRWLEEDSGFLGVTSKHGNCVANWPNSPGFADDRVVYKGSLSVALTFQRITKRVGCPIEARKQVVEAWLKLYEHKPTQALKIYNIIRVPAPAVTALLDVQHLRTLPLNRLIKALATLSNHDQASHFPEGKSVQQWLSNGEAYQDIWPTIMNSDVGKAMQTLAPHIYDAFCDPGFAAQASHSHFALVARLRLAVGQWLALCAAEKVLLQPLTATGLSEAVRHLGDVLPQYIETKEEVARIRDEGSPSEKKGNLVRLQHVRSRLLCCTTIHRYEDWPENIRDFFGRNSLYGVWFAAVLNEYSEEKGLRHWPIELLNRNKLAPKTAATKFSIEWAVENLNPSWTDFYTTWVKATPQISVNSRGHKMSKLLEWAQVTGIESPWDITPERIHNVFAPKDTTSFFNFLKHIEKEVNQAPRQTRHFTTRKSSIGHISWNGGRAAYDTVLNAAKLPNSPISFNIDNYENPFKGQPNPFKFNRNRNGNKTPRGRMLTEIQEALIDKLLGWEKVERKVLVPIRGANGECLLDDAGKPLFEDSPRTVEVMVPTFSWARERAMELETRLRSGAAECFTYNGERLWNPSTAVALAIILLLPLRGKQVRWLDQGLMDSQIYDRDKNVMVVNPHPLANWRYENGLTHEDHYGRGSSVLQLSKDEMTGELETVIWSSTNKTALWDGESRTGYALPWPDGLTMLLSDDNEVVKRGHQLARVYEVLRYQYEFMERYDPNPCPLTFIHVAEDKRNIPSEEELQQGLPWFVPLCRNIEQKVTITTPDGETRRASLPVGKENIERLYNALCLEVERELRKDKRLAKLSLTVPHRGNNHIDGRMARYDIHSLRVAGISRLLELGIPAHIVSEYVAGHQTIVMTLKYFQTTPMHLRKQLMEAMLKGDVLDGWEVIAERLAQGADVKTLLPAAREVRDHVIDLPPDFAALAPVPGGVCLTGGLGSRCHECGVHIEELPNGTTTTGYRQKVGGCAGGRFYRTGPDFMLQQALEANKLMLLLRRKARERKVAHEQVSSLRKQIQTQELDIQLGYSELESKAHRQLDNLKVKLQGARNRLAEQDEALAPLMLQWFQRWRDFNDSGLLSENLSENTLGVTQLVLVGEEHIDFSPEVVAGPDFTLTRTVLEQALCYSRSGLPMPEDARLLLDDFLNRIIAVEDPELLMLYNSVRDPETRDWQASVIANFLAEKFGDDMVQRAAKDGVRLGLSYGDHASLENLMERIGKTKPDDHGHIGLVPIKVLTHDDLTEEA
ncbi:conserved hypothetical protein [Vibrio chagasii]|nr:conserved hypothetical protein [Vibrio chagasii]CAH7235089.1 conserved hypothetical protein [Vibrio chagasii]